MALDLAYLLPSRSGLGQTIQPATGLLGSDIGHSCCEAGCASLGPYYYSEQSAAISLLPEELLQRVLSHCDPNQLASLEATCRLFGGGCSTGEAAQVKLGQIPWTGCLSPKDGETWVTLLRYALAKNIALPQATALSLGSSHTSVILSSPGNRQSRLLTTFGQGCNGELGQGTFSTSAVPLYHLDSSSVLIGSSSEGSRVLNPSIVACGRGQTVVITRRGELHAWGLPLQGCHTSPVEGFQGSSMPAKVLLQNGVRIVGICQGTGHTLAISEHHQLLACGQNQYGQLGIAYCGDATRMQLVNLGQQGVASVAAGESHSLALEFDGTVWAWGLGNDGQLGHEVIASVMKQNVNTQRPIVLHEPKRIATLRPENLPAHDRVSGISAGGYHSAILTLGGGLLCFGNNCFGCLGTGDHKPCFVPTKVDLDCLRKGQRAPARAIQVACGKHHTLALIHCGGRSFVCGAGLNDNYQLGLGDCRSRASFTEIPFPRGVEIASVVSGHHHCAAVSTAGQLFFWGQGSFGQLGHGQYSHVQRPTAFAGGNVVHPSITLGLRPQHYYHNESSREGGDAEGASPTAGNNEQPGCIKT